MFRLIATDIDGTLINDDHHVTPFTREIFQKAKQQGYEVVIATGRDHDSAQEIAGELGFNSDDIAILSNNGLHVSYPKGGYFVKESTMSYEDCKHFEVVGEKYYMGILYLCKGVIYFQMDDRSLSDFEVGMDVNRMIYFNEHLKTVRIQSVEEIKTEFSKGLEVEKMVYIQHPDYLELMKERLMKEFPDDYTLLIVSEGWSEIMPRKINKGDALLTLAKAMGVDPEAIIAFGDSDNDLTMIQHAGRGVAVKNARETLKIIADDITPYTNDENGVALYIEQHLLKV